MNGSISILLYLAGALALFLYGMKVMCEGLQRAQGGTLRKILRRMTHNRFLGILSGIGITSLIQSSSAVTVLTVSFVNAKLLTLLESLSLIIGANIGTTIKAWFIAYSLTDLPLRLISMPLLLIGVALQFSKRRHGWRHWGEVFLGLSLLFLGLELLADALPDLHTHPDALNWLAQWTASGFSSVLLFLVVGIVLTAVVQSSSATTALALVMASRGWIGYEIAVALTLGANIGTCATAEIAAIIGNRAARTAARMHTLFNVFGVVVALLLFYPLLQLNSFLVHSIFGVPEMGKETNVLAVYVASYHTLFNVLSAIIIAPLSSWLLKIAALTVRKPDEHEEVFRVEYLTASFKTPELYLLEVQQEVARYAEVTSRMNGFASDLLQSVEKRTQDIYYEKLEKYEAITDRFEIELTNYLDRITLEELTPKSSIRVRNLVKVCAFLEQLGDIYFQIGRVFEQKNKDKIWLHPAQRTLLKELFEITSQSWEVLVQLLGSEYHDEPAFQQIRTNYLNVRKQSQKARMDLGNPDQSNNELNPRNTAVFNHLLNHLDNIHRQIRDLSKVMVSETVVA